MARSWSSSSRRRSHRVVGRAPPRRAHGRVCWPVEAVLAWLWPAAYVASPLLLAAVALAGSLACTHAACVVSACAAAPPPSCHRIARQLATSRCHCRATARCRRVHLCLCVAARPDFVHVVTGTGILIFHQVEVTIIVAENDTSIRLQIERSNLQS